MKKYQKLLALLLALAMVAALAGCGSNGSSGNQSASSGGSAASTSGEGGCLDGDGDPARQRGEPVYGGNLNCYYNSDIDAYFDPAIGDTVCWNLFSEGACGPMTRPPVTP